MEMPPEEIVELVRWPDAEVNNGGFHQFFNNSAGNRTAATIATARLKALQGISRL
jgi:hypothetical protein